MIASRPMLQVFSMWRVLSCSRGRRKDVPEVQGFACSSRHPEVRETHSSRRITSTYSRPGGNMRSTYKFCKRLAYITPPPFCVHLAQSTQQMPVYIHAVNTCPLWP
jgi:hypothetical protein